MSAKKKKRGIDDESLFRLASIAIHEQLSEQGGSIIKSNKRIFSEEEIQKRWERDLQEHHLNTYRKQNWKHKIQKAIFAAVSSLIVASSSVATVMAVNPAIREMVLTDFGQYSTLNMLFSEKKAEIPKDWQEQYYPRYIPEGFTYKETKLGSKIKGLIYVNSKKQFLSFIVIAPGTDIDIDTENMMKTEIKVKNHDAILFEKNDKLHSSIVINYEDCIIRIYGPISGEEITKIAENISE